MSPTIEVDDEVFSALQDHAVPFVDDPNSVIRRLLALGDDRPPAAGGGPGHHRRRRRGSDGLDYDRLVLRTVFDLGGAATPADVLSDLERQLSNGLTRGERAELASGAIQWHSNVRSAAIRLKRKGFLDGDSPRGIWEISEAGKRICEADQNSAKIEPSAPVTLE